VRWYAVSACMPNASLVAPEITAHTDLVNEGFTVMECIYLRKPSHLFHETDCEKCGRLIGITYIEYISYIKHVVFFFSLQIIAEDPKAQSGSLLSGSLTLSL